MQEKSETEKGSEEYSKTEGRGFMVWGVRGRVCDAIGSGWGGSTMPWKTGTRAAKPPETQHVLPPLLCCFSPCVPLLLICRQACFVFLCTCPLSSPQLYVISGPDTHTQNWSLGNSTERIAGKRIDRPGSSQHLPLSSSPKREGSSYTPPSELPELLPQLRK